MDDDFVLSNENFTKIEMPNAKGFIPNIEGKDGVKNVKTFLSDGKNIGAIGSRCMKIVKMMGQSLCVEDPRTEIDPPLVKLETFQRRKIQYSSRSRGL